jgi:hypothetical protein
MTLGHQKDLLMNTEATTYSGYIKGLDEEHHAFTRPGYLTKFRNFIEHSDWEKVILAQEAWLNKGCIGVIIVAAIYYLPLLIKVFLK